MTDGSEISSDSLLEYVEYAELITGKYPQMDEENTKWKLIHEFLELLGWDVAFDAELEYSITIGNASTYHVDYALFGSSPTPVLFVETKGYDTVLTDKHRGQLHSYLRQTDVNWGLLSNGQSYEIYRREIVDNGVKIRTVARIDLEELPQYTDYINLLSKGALESGRSQKLAQRILDLRKAQQTLQDEKEELAEDLARVLTDTAGKVISQEAKTEAKILIDRLVETLETRTETRRNKPDSFWDGIEEAVGIQRTEESVDLVNGHSAKQDYVAFVSYLFDQDYLTSGDVPYGKGRKRYVLNSEMKHKDGDDMYNPVEVADGVFLETHNSTASIKRRIVELGKIAQKNANR